MKNMNLYLTVVNDTATTTAQSFALKSSDLQDPITNKHVYNGSGCAGENLSPQLSWDNPPKGTESFAVIMSDPDSSKEGGWTHWAIFDIPADINELGTGAGTVGAKAAPEQVVQSLNDFGEHGYGGPCPPKDSPAHRYEITVYALKTDKLGLHNDASPSVVRSHIEMYRLGKAVIESHYGR